MNKEDLAILFHDTYERLAPSFGYETREDTRKFDENSPNGKLMMAVCEEVLKTFQQDEQELIEWLEKQIPEYRDKFKQSGNDTYFGVARGYENVLNKLIKMKNN